MKNKDIPVFANRQVINPRQDILPNILPGSSDIPGIYPANQSAF